MQESLFYKDHLVTKTDFKKIKKKVTIGIDEAGRGPVLGHMVYAVLISDNANQHFDDSKKISPAKREACFNTIKSTLSYAYTAIHPTYLSVNMESSPCKNLNTISYETVVNLIKLIKKEYEIECVYCDALGPIKTYSDIIRTVLPDSKIVVENKADSKYGIVGGASIVAKVVRDGLLSGWQLEDKDVGSGYPGDEITVRWLKRNFCEVFGFPDIVRFSWKTAKEFFDVKEGKMIKDTGLYI